MTVRVWAFLFGIALVAGGVTGFMPSFLTGDKLFGIFQVDAMHNIIHLVSGVVALLAAISSAVYSRLYFRIFGLIYGVLAVVGFLYGSEMESIMHMNMADHFLHLGIAVVSLYIGFTTKIAR